ncbi:pyridoxal phosphate-dependent aminotransferase [Halococcus sediminicola]|uniref:pyridoxal phosphate-dependent aminotransferase n=1 Tax=Halococcus sediminicola TaxID=1264579 RepID=UPI0009AC5799|nr:pyridoxal phosphate-dependent aminotransferase [Halococcus sediminicola]
MDQHIPASLSDNAANLPESGIRKMFNLAEEQDDDLVRLELGEPDFDTPEHIVDAAYEAAQNGATRYTHSAGMPKLRKAVAEMTQESGRKTDSASEVLITTGAIEAIYFALLTTTNPGEEVIVPTPAWSSYYTQAKALGINLTEVPMPEDEGFDISPDRLSNAITDETSCVIINTPCNPTGQVYGEEDLKEVVEIANENGSYVIFDIVYENLSYTDKSPNISAIADDANNVLLAHSFSKTYAMTGWRVGWLIGPEPIIDAGAKLHQATTSCVSSVSQHAALAALNGPQTPSTEMYQAFQSRRDYFVKRVDSIPEITCANPQGTFYAFPNVSALEGSSFEIAKRLLLEYGVVTVPGTSFGAAGSGYLRLSFANSMEQLELALDRLEEMVYDELKIS